MTDIKSHKDRVRREARACRATAATQSPDASERAARIFLDAVSVKSGDTVALYRAIQSELDPAPLAATLSARGIGLCYPVVKAPDTALEFRGADPETRFVPGAFGAAIPEDGSPIVVPSVIVTPLLAFDRELYRLGYGGGFYDRTLEKLRESRNTRAYGYAYAAQELALVPIDDTDQRLDGIVTETAFLTAQD